jgi:hypothetical protein
MTVIGFIVVGGIIAILITIFWVLFALTRRGGRRTIEQSAVAPGGHRRVLVLLTTDCVDERVCREIMDREEPVEIRVAVPTPISRFGYYVTGDDRAVQDVAERRLAGALAMLEEQGVPCSGVLGDASAGPEQLIEDELASYGPDEIVIVIHPELDRTWPEHALVEEAVARLDVPVVVVHSHVIRDDAPLDA